MEGELRHLVVHCPDSMVVYTSTINFWSVYFILHFDPHIFLFTKIALLKFASTFLLIFNRENLGKICVCSLELWDLSNLLLSSNIRGILLLLGDSSFEGHSLLGILRFFRNSFRQFLVFAVAVSPFEVVISDLFEIFDLIFSRGILHVQLWDVADLLRLLGASFICELWVPFDHYSYLFGNNL